MTAYRPDSSNAGLAEAGLARLLRRLVPAPEWARVAAVMSQAVALDDGQLTVFLDRLAEVIEGGGASLGASQVEAVLAQARSHRGGVGGALSGSDPPPPH